jgi:hypothetical protein
MFNADNSRKQCGKCADRPGTCVDRVNHERMTHVGNTRCVCGPCNAMNPNRAAKRLKLD